jgi:hypothetical protein
VAAATCLAQQILNNDSIIRMAKAGLSDSLIVTTINNQPGQYDTSASSIIALKTAGVSDTVIAALLTRSAAPATPAPAPTPSTPAAAPARATPPAPVNPDDPNSPHDPGIYLVSNSNREGKMIDIAPSLITRSLLGGSRGHVTGSHAAVRCKSGGIDFYFFFPSAENDQSRSESDLGDATAPEDFALLKLNVKSKEREVLLTYEPFMTWTPHLKDKVPVSSVRVRAGVYKVSTVTPLPAGEYGIFSLKTMAQPPHSTVTNKVDSQVFDFGVD